ncbi:hypothetical protein [Tahibacter amnicola]|uniref:Uncharacterized protein n=1 Tax=Tahibacter amnicola TaxID=2976241 RepID=A0ABY6BEQ8_9GAMM|nr:hypothetical protein [Tahibacter amnicola]UXI68524.1 hypothetical protein N4264_02395 [Tahibacter amnicola]
MMPDIPALIPAIAAALFGLASLLQAFAVRRRWRDRRRLSACHRGAWLLAFLLITLLSAGLSTSLRGYQRLVAEAPVADIQVRAVAPNTWALRVDLADGTHETVQLSGDDWQLDARVIKWTPRAVTLGAEPLYRVERISGRWRNAAVAQTQPPSIVDLAGDNVLDLWQVKRRFPAWLPFVDADFGSATYMPLIDGARYRVSLAAAGGLVARPADPATAELIKASGW